MKRREDRFKRRGEEFGRRGLGRPENFLDTELKENTIMERSASRSELNTEVYRDKNTLVEVTIHRRPKEKEHKKDLNQFARPTSSSLSRAKKSPGKMKKSAKSISVDRHRNKDDRLSKKDDRSVRDILGELKDIVKVSAIKDVHAFIDENDSTSKTSILKQVKSPKKLCQKPDYTDHEKKIEKLESVCEKYKKEAIRYKHEYDVMVKNVEISKDTVNSLEAQVADLKKIVSRLTRNNGELLGIVSETINYEDLIADLKNNKVYLANQLNEEKSHSSQLEDKLQSAESEAAGLRLLSVELRAGLVHGLAGLDLARPASRQELLSFGDDTKNILGIKEGEEVQSDTDDDSAYDDPNTESLRSRHKSAQNKDNALEGFRPLAQAHMLKQKVLPQPITTSQVFQTNTQIPPNITPSPPTKMTSPPQDFLPPQQSPPPTSTLDLLPPPAQSRSSTLAKSPAAEASQAFQPLPLDLSETSQTFGVEKQILFQGQNSSSTPPTVIENFVPQEKPTKQSLETKVSSFLSRLHQDSLQLQLSHPLPKAEPFPGASMHLSLSSSDIDQDITGQSVNTTLTEGRFLRGLETSIEVLQAEL